MDDVRREIARNAAARLHAEYERVRALRHARGPEAFATRVCGQGRQVVDLTQAGAQRVLGRVAS